MKVHLKMGPNFSIFLSNKDTCRDSCCVTRMAQTPDRGDSDTTLKILNPIELAVISKSIGDGKRHNNYFIVRVRARPQL